MVVFHYNGAGDKSAVMPVGYWHLATCLRSIVVSEHEVAPMGFEHYEVYRGHDAYEFLLQVICGLHSPLIGETEILGQFKEFVKANKSSFSGNIHSAMDMLLKESKQIRTKYLQNLGCTSYGSLLRKHMKGQKMPLFFVGAGSLAEDILPWFAKSGVDINLFTRNPEGKEKLQDTYKTMNLSSYENISSERMKGVLVIVAPVSAEWLQTKLDIEKFDLVYDLRGESANDPLTFKNVVSLKVLFADIEANKQQASLVKKRVKEAIKSCAVKFSLVEKQRPFGWEDLWAYS